MRLPKVRNMIQNINASSRGSSQASAMRLASVAGRKDEKSLPTKVQVGVGL